MIRTQPRAAQSAARVFIYRDPKAAIPPLGGLSNAGRNAGAFKLQGPCGWGLVRNAGGFRTKPHPHSAPIWGGVGRLAGWGCGWISGRNAGALQGEMQGR